MSKIIPQASTTPPVSSAFYTCVSRGDICFVPIISENEFTKRGMRMIQKSIRESVDEQRLYRREEYKEQRVRGDKHKRDKWKKGMGKGRDANKADNGDGAVLLQPDMNSIEAEALVIPEEITFNALRWITMWRLALDALEVKMPLQPTRKQQQQQHGKGNPFEDMGKVGGGYGRDNGAYDADYERPAFGSEIGNDGLPLHRILVLAGPSGVGKSTLARSICRMKEFEPYDLAQLLFKDNGDAKPELLVKSINRLATTRGFFGKRKAFIVDDIDTQEQRQLLRALVSIYITSPTKPNVPLIVTTRNLYAQSLRPLLGGTLMWSNSSNSNYSNRGNAKLTECSILRVPPPDVELLKNSIESHCSGKIIEKMIDDAIVKSDGNINAVYNTLNFMLANKKMSTTGQVKELMSPQVQSSISTLVSNILSHSIQLPGGMSGDLTFFNAYQMLRGREDANSVCLTLYEQWDTTGLASAHDVQMRSDAPLMELLDYLSTADCNRAEAFRVQRSDIASLVSCIPPMYAFTAPRGSHNISRQTRSKQFGVLRQLATSQQTNQYLLDSLPHTSWSSQHIFPTQTVPYLRGMLNSHTLRVHNAGTSNKQAQVLSAQGVIKSLSLELSQRRQATGDIATQFNPPYLRLGHYEGFDIPHLPVATLVYVRGYKPGDDTLDNTQKVEEYMDLDAPKVLGDILYEYHEGVTNAVRRKATLARILGREQWTE